MILKKRKHHYKLLFILRMRIYNRLLMKNVGGFDFSRGWYKSDQNDDVSENHDEEREPLDYGREMSPRRFLSPRFRNFRIVLNVFAKYPLAGQFGIALGKNKETPGSVVQDERCCRRNPIWHLDAHFLHFPKQSG